MQNNEKHVYTFQSNQKALKKKDLSGNLTTDCLQKGNKPSNKTSKRLRSKQYKKTALQVLDTTEKWTDETTGNRDNLCRQRTLNRQDLKHERPLDGQARHFIGDYG